MAKTPFERILGSLASAKAHASRGNRPGIEVHDAGGPGNGMALSEFQIGVEFSCSGARYRCTDIGTRTVIAIRVDQATIATKELGESVTTRTISGEKAEAIGWFEGPPYGVLEQVFDEDDRLVCEPA